MKKIYLFLLPVLALFIVHPYSSAQTIEVSGNITENTTWSADTVKVKGDLYIGAEATLTIKPGVYIQFLGHYKISVDGQVSAIGKPDSMIIFTINDTIGFSDIESEAGGWNGISYYQGGLQGFDFFHYCRFEFSKAASESHGDGGAFYLNAQSGRIMNFFQCEFIHNQAKNCGGAIFSVYSCPQINNCYFSQNRASTGGAIYVGDSGPWSGTFSENTFVQNEAYIDGGALNFSNSHFIVVNNKIVNNKVIIGDGGGICLIQTEDILEGNVIANNTSNRGGGISIWISSPKVYNNTICNNHATHAGGGIYVWGLSNSDFVNNVLWGNTSLAESENVLEQIFIAHVTSKPNFYNCIIQDSLSGIHTDVNVTYEGNTKEIYNQDPFFNNPTDSSGLEYNALIADWSLSDSSMAINNGSDAVKKLLSSNTDLWNNPRIRHGIIDIGANEAHIVKLTAEDTISKNTRWIADTVKVEEDILIKDSITLDISPGCCVKFQGNYLLNVQGTLKAIGTETDPILFTINDTSGFSNIDTTSGSWKGIVFDDSQYGAKNIMSDNDTSWIVNCILEYAKDYNPDWTPEFPKGGALKIKYFSNLVIKNCTIRYNQALDGGGINIEMNSDPIISSNIIYKNRAAQSGGGINCDDYSDPIISHNFIINNSANLGSGIQIKKSNPVFQNNVVCNNFSFWDEAAIRMEGGKPLFSNNTVCNNYGGGMILWNSYISIYNSVFRGNSFNRWPGLQCWAVEKINYYNNNIEGGESGTNIQYYPGDFIGIIDSTPMFRNPTAGHGIEYDALYSDWSLSDLSPNINKGTPDISSLKLSDKDIAGNNRINYGRIDIGAYESQASPLEIIYQPSNQLACVGDSVNFMVRASGPAYFQWYKNNQPISGAHDSILVINPVTSDDESMYSCTAANGYGSKTSNNVLLVVKIPPKILASPENQWININNPLKLHVSVDGTAPLSYQWKKDNLNLSGALLPDYSVSKPGYDQEGAYTCMISNSCGEIMTSPAIIYLAPQICMVTVSTATGNNLVVWEKNSIAPIAQYNIYRESKYAGIYDLLTTVPYDQLSIYNDTTADPTSRAYLYKITAVDTSGYETDLGLCTTHKTIHLLVTMNPETKATQLDWDRYVGFDYGTYEIFRSDTTINFLSIDAMSSSTSTWSDPDPGTGTKYYRIAALRPEPCYPTGTADKKADSGPYSHSMSNMEDNRLQTGISGSFLINQNLMVYPNPFNKSTTLMFNNPESYSYTLFIMDLSGKVYRIVDNINTSKYVLEKGDLKEGFYFIELRGTKIYRGKIVIE